MCHHGDEAILESWRQADDRPHEEPEPEEPDDPSFANEEREVDVDLLEADDD